MWPLPWRFSWSSFSYSCAVWRWFKMMILLCIFVTSKWLFFCIRIKKPVCYQLNITFVHFPFHLVPLFRRGDANCDTVTSMPSFEFVVASVHVEPIEVLLANFQLLIRWNELWNARNNTTQEKLKMSIEWRKTVFTGKTRIEKENDDFSPKPSIICRLSNFTVG